MRLCIRCLSRPAILGSICQKCHDEIWKEKENEVKLFEGEIIKPRVWKRDLTPEEVLLVYQGREDEIIE